VKTRLYLFATALLVANAAAQGDYTVEALAAIADGQRAELDLTSARQLGSTTRFDVRVVWSEPSRRPQEAAARKLVRYLADCVKRELAVAGVGLEDDNGRMLKSAIVPPGTYEYFKPAAGSREAQWLDEVCKSN
jgi:hypothetical protein